MRDAQINCGTSIKGEINIYVCTNHGYIFREKERERERERERWSVNGGQNRERNICSINLRSHDLGYNFFFGSFLECQGSHKNSHRNLMESWCLWRDKN